MELTRFATADALLAVAGAYLAEREAEHNLPLGILDTLRVQPDLYPEPPYLAVVRDRGRIALVAIRTPPYGIVLSESGVRPDRERDAITTLVDDLLAAAPDLPTALGAPRLVAPLVERWSAATGRPARLELEERIYRLGRVIPHPPVPGGWRLAGPGDRDLLHGWYRDFQAEALPGSPSTPDAVIDRLVAQDDRFAYLWEVRGRVVSLVVAAARTPNGRRIGPVYTPPEDRRRGYAGALTAAASQDQLDRGRRFCFLFTDLANPTSNAIYRAVGYEPVSDVHEYRFSARQPLSAARAR
jgi:GNAT superfamily N-acetyltransferase